MANLHQAFIDFGKTVKLTEAKKTDIRRRRDVVRNKIRVFFKDELKYNQPKFQSQGSFTINTALNPINGNEVDIDDGIYLQHVSQNENEWPSPKEAHRLIVEALEDHTKDGCEDKTSCVRLIYSNDFHIDFPIYIMKNEHARLANTKTNTWIESDSKDFKDWFYANRKSEQTNRIIRYLKSWRDFTKADFTSIELTILVVNNFYGDDRDDIALYQTLEKCLKALNTNRGVKKPVSPYEDLWENYSESTKNILIQKLSKLMNDIETAINNHSDNRASIIMREQFGDRFPKLNDKTATPIKEFSIGAKPWQL
ncbi:hypothetical protein E4O00_07290 [Treponema sp. OMZ 788]|uniref:cyclic GMP-AMP synthase DncV-like nucleotidyltransferase n=1 Tax=Treponema sp. OMZ 788 TaxID=2563664 RepID=UPI0020A2CD72|nr:hypothetical protein [Treponema sp. OMZ 788]UTC63747.1 hypothetical protein E4O00_07290 [Treponema sp. OMZ 788]